MSDEIRQRRIVCAAMLHQDGSIICSPRHYDPIARAQVKMSGKVWKGFETQGFVDQWGVFITREDALEIAKKAGQIIRRCGGDKRELFSENLY